MHNILQHAAAAKEYAATSTVWCLSKLPLLFQFSGSPEFSSMFLLFQKNNFSFIADMLKSIC
jgi:hypothetical protein